MATLTSFFRWFSGSNKKVASQGDDSSPREPKAANEAKSKENNADKSPPIPMSYFPIGTRFTSEEDDRIPPASTRAKARNEDKPKESSRKKNPPVPVNYFPIGARLNLL
ncbi:hypothetical protein V6N11_005580 [Hibiscus sabdariffa]|uniref:Uncharacterized protein n=1 Tax=Hibiscus sabdariffa TaxID=183260 RepID=A0ABR2RP30_9ROSI